MGQAKRRKELGKYPVKRKSWIKRLRSWFEYEKESGVVITIAMMHEMIRYEIEGLEDKA